MQANLAFSAKQADLKRSGLGDTQSWPPIDENDIDKLYKSNVFDINTPAGLQSKVWFELMLFICRRGRENLRKLEKDHFAITQDSNGRRYVYQSKDELTKRIRGTDMKSRVDGGRMYATDGQGCPVASFEKYVAKLNPKCAAFFQAPMPANRKGIWNDDDQWFKNAPIGEKTLGSFMSKISLAANLSRRYTNHSLRSTCITLLDESGFATRDICNISGHRNEKSIRSYIGRPNDAKKQKLSDALSTSIGCTPPHQPATSRPTRKMASAPSTVSAPPSTVSAPPSTVSAPPSTVSAPPSTVSVNDNDSSENFGNFDLPLTNSQLDTLEEIVVQTVQTQETASTTHSRMIHQRQTQSTQQQPFTFNNCKHVTINYNFKN